jgi:hypothetical protein
MLFAAVPSDPLLARTDVPTTLRDVRSQGQSGKHMLA